jgi:SET domain-containing protein
MLVRRRSKLHGCGIFTDRPITKNTRIIDYAGEKISHQESLRRERRYMKQGRIWCFQINRRWIRDAAVDGNLARYINHSCHPNCYVHIVGDTIWIRAARNIRRGEELTYDYMTDGEGQINCRCRPGCQRLL